MQALRWYKEDDKHYGWTADRDMREDEHNFLVMSPEPGVWAGWEVYEDGERQCVTLDFTSADAAMESLEEMVYKRSRFVIE